MQRGGPVGLLANHYCVVCSCGGSFPTQPGNVTSSRALVTSFPTQPGNVASSRALVKQKTKPTIYIESLKCIIRVQIVRNFK